MEGNIENDILEIKKLEHCDEPYIISEQSANVLFNFMKKPEYLKLIISNKAIIPRYYEESIDYLELNDIKKIAFPMTCFCDINIQKLMNHVHFYGWYGIGFDKKWGINKGIQPIHYINKKSNLREDFSNIFNASMKKIEEKNSELDEYNNYLLTSLLFMKPHHGEMYRDKKYVVRNFHDEKEWRYIPKMHKDDDLPLVVPQFQLNPNAYNSYSEVIKTRKDLWLYFEFHDIKYLIVRDEFDREEFINYITNEITSNQIEKSLLISKIIVLDEIRKDW